MSLEMFAELCEELRSRNTRTLFLTGEGEPLLHHWISDLISLAKEKGMHVTLITNGTLLDERRIESLFGAGLDVLQVSLWACSPEDYKRQYHGSDSANFQKVIDSIRTLCRLRKEKAKTRPLVRLHQPINRFNFRKISKTADLALSTGCDEISFSPLLSAQGQLHEYVLSSGEKEELLYSLKTLAERLRPLPIEHNIAPTLLRYDSYGESGKKMPCYAGWFSCEVKVDGTVIPCGSCNIIMGSLAEKSFGEIWNGAAYRAFRRQAMTAEGLSNLAGSCDCEHCCYAEDNLRVHKLFKPLAPLLFSR
jgi:MoaA/NifB/PqqE/SkfB family radical SAM enzyme